MATSRSLNKVIIIGNLSRDPEIRYTQNGGLVCTFGVATNSSWMDSNGEQKELTEWHNLVAWNKLGEICANILSKGMLVYLEGELRTRVWGEGSDKKYRTEIKVSDMKLLDSKGKSGIGMEGARAEQETSKTENTEVKEEVEKVVTRPKEEVKEDLVEEDDDDEEDLPF